MLTSIPRPILKSKANYVFVLDTHHQTVGLIHPALARKWKDQQLAAEYRRTYSRSLTGGHAKTRIRQRPTEWWHFDYPNWQDYDLLDIPFN